MKPFPVLHRLAPAVIAGVAAAIVIVFAGVLKGSFVAGAADAYGYVSEADLIAHGRLSVDQPFVRTMPWPFADWSFSPAGYRPAPWRGSIVPTYSAGVPLVMALFQRVAGRRAVFYVVPLFGGLCVLATALLGGSVHRDLTGAIAAALLATSPSFLVELMAPASDVAAAAWWTIALAAAIAESAPGALVSGLAASFAVLTRPNLVLLNLVIAGFLAVRRWPARQRSRPVVRVALFAAGAAPGCIAVAILNARLYGSPLSSGYESLDALFRWSNAPANLDRYPRWLVQTQTPFVALGLVAPWLVRSDRDDAHRTPGADVRALWLLLVWVLAVCGAYLFYRPFGRDEWTYLRFLLPAYPALLVLLVVALFAATQRVVQGPKRAAAIAIALCTALGGWQLRESSRRGAFTTRAIERRYVDVAHYVDTTLPSNVVCIARLHAGSLRYYANRLTLYYDRLQPAWLDTAVRELSARGYHPVIVIERDEEPGFRERFGDANAIGRLDWPPAAELMTPVDVRIYDPADRDRVRAGQSVVTQPIFRWAGFR